MNPTNSTTPSAGGWISEPDGRGTAGLLWSCFATIFICTWSVVHPNIPADKDTDLRVFGERLQLLLGGILAPEIYTAGACTNWIEARALKKDLSGWTLRQRFFLTMGGFCLQRNSNDPTSRVRLEPKDAVRLWRDGLVPWPTIDDSDIDNYSKADWLTKSIALVQVLWFLMQIIARATKGLPITTLELFTAGIVFCSVITYLFWWEKPFDVRKPVVLHPNEAFTKSQPTWLQDAAKIGLAQHRTEAHTVQIVVGVVTTIVFGALHLAAWDFYFPSLVEKWLWRSASISSVCLPLVVMAAMLMTESKLIEKFGVVVAGLYCVVRSYMFIEMLVGLRDVPTGVYNTVEWSQYFPSFG